eukprot:scaffold206285_cov23-Tisochrysis_lutea.AAC.1
MSWYTTIICKVAASRLALGRHRLLERTQRTGLAPGCANNAYSLQILCHAAYFAPLGAKEAGGRGPHANGGTVSCLWASRHGERAVHKRYM